METFYEIIEKINDNNIYIHYEPNVINISKLTNIKIILTSKEYSIEIPVPEEEQRLKEIISLLTLYVFSSKNIIFCWKLKNLISYFFRVTGKKIDIGKNILDLSIIEKYLSVNKNKPNTFKECLFRFKEISQHVNFNKSIDVYKKVYYKLVTTIAEIENNFLIDEKNKTKVYSHYELDEHSNGRLKTFSNFPKNYYNPHLINEENSKYLNCYGFENYFVNIDIINAEVSVLQWLSKDEKLLKLIESGDAYKCLWEEITKSSCNEKSRKICKDIFLPIIYGMGAKGFSEKINLDINICDLFIKKLKNLIPKAFEYVENQVPLYGNFYEDYYGRIREIDKSYISRNFCIQSPAAFIYLDKLNLLFENLKDYGKICMNIHDGYILSSKKDNLNKIKELSEFVFKEKDDLYPGLKFNFKIGYGKKINDIFYI